MKWLFILVVVNQQGNVDVIEQQSYLEMVDCYKVKNYVLESMGEPFNYQALCIPTNVKNVKEQNMVRLGNFKELILIDDSKTSHSWDDIDTVFLSIDGDTVKIHINPDESEFEEEIV